MYRIIGIIDGHYVVRTPKELKKMKIDIQNKKTLMMKLKLKNYSF